ncbi:hypothetical protein LRAMOSA02048 [Lichtheimia ramosa]|uniref:Uncharacterized protein n=1 Tax=Lichtheimia ramosa TaxID=688394 RepID=A0A077WM15_9FUNG|nr:hypothetical protein LRAMOSA02048 [Lichtheimia ramosa]
MSVVDDRDDESILLPPEMPPPALEQRATTTFRSPKEVLTDLIHKVDTTDLQYAMKNEIKRLMNDHERLVCMLQQRSELLENENGQLKMASLESQRRYEKAVREMQFFRRKCEMQKRPRSLSIESGSSSEAAVAAAAANNKNKYPLTPTSPQNSTSILDKNSRSSSQSTSNSAEYQRMIAEQQEQHPPPPPPPPPQTPPPAVPHQLNSSPTTTTLASTTSSAHTVSSSNTNASTSSNNKSNATSVAVPPPSRSTATASTTTTTTSSLIQQRRVDPLIFGGSDALWETIAKSKGSDVTVEKIIGNFLRRGGSPNTAKQSPTSHAVMYGYGMIHALIVTKAPGSLDLLLEQGANPNVMTLSQIEDDKVTPCYLAASVGWLAGLQKLVQAGGDLMAARGAGVKNKTALHVAAEHCHAAVVEYIVSETKGALNLEEDSHGATVLHYACASGHTDLVSFLARSCQIPVNQPDHRGELPLHWAAKHGRLEVVTLLIERCGCDMNIYVPRKVGTPMDLAKNNNHRRLMDYLKGLGALTAKKLEKRREDEAGDNGKPEVLENRLEKNGFFFNDDDE